MKRIYKAIIIMSLAAFLLLTTAPTAPAQPVGPFYVGVFGGLVVPSDLEVNEDGYDYHHDNSHDIDVDESWTIGAKFGFIIPQVPWLAAELEYTYLADQDYSDTAYYGNSKLSADGDFSAHNVMANLLFRYPFGRIHPYVGFGLGVSMATFEEHDKVKINGQTVDSSNYDEDDTAFASQFIAGVNFEIAPNISADLAYKYLYSEYELEYVDVDHGNSLFTLGINFHF